MLVTPSGITMLVRLLQPLNAESPMLVTPSGITMLVRLLQKTNALAPMLVTGFPSYIEGIIIFVDSIAFYDNTLT